jgi:hypothetical protein
MLVSGFPNQLAHILFLFPFLPSLALTWYACWIARVAQEDNLGQFYLMNIDFLKNGIPASIIAMSVRVSSRDWVFGHSD